ncbi:thioredoxin family protein [Lacinutrix salivirga]
MKNLILTLLFAAFTVGTVAAQDINWITLEEAVKRQKKNPKKIMIDVYTNWCGPCKLLDKNTFQNKDVADYVNKNYYAVKFNAEGNAVVKFKGQTYNNPGYKPELAKRRNTAHQLSRYFQIKSYPTIVFLDEKAEFIAPISGYRKPKQLELYLKMFKNDDHKALDTQNKFNDYYKAFTPVFVENTK